MERDGSSPDYRKDKWQMYRASFKVRSYQSFTWDDNNTLLQDSVISLLEEDMMTLKTPHLSIDNEETIIAICNIAENFMYEDVDSEITMDGKKKY